MVTRAKRPMAMCCVSIGYQDFLLPVDRGMRLVELMQEAVLCHENYADGRVYVVDPEQPQISMTVIKPSQVNPAPTKPSGEKSLPLLLGHD